MIVTVVAYKRPELLDRCLESIANADLTLVSYVAISIDWHSTAMRQAMFEVFSKYRFCLKFRALRFLTLFNETRLGVANHPRALFNTLYEEQENTLGAAYLGATKESFCALEEDTIVSPDAFTFADWALRQPGGYKFVNLYSPRKWPVELTFWTAPGGFDENMRVHEDHELRGLFGWAFTRSFWRALEPQWNGKVRYPYGADYQITHLCYRNNWRCLTPEVSRVYNTGREGGTYDTPANWDATQKDVVICQCAPAKYVVVKHNLDSVTAPDWVKEEMRL